MNCIKMHATSSQEKWAFLFKKGFSRRGVGALRAHTPTGEALFGEKGPIFGVKMGLLKVTLEDL